MQHCSITRSEMARMVPSGTPLFGVPFGELLGLPITVLKAAISASSVTFGPSLKQITWDVDLDDAHVILVWHVVTGSAMLAARDTVKPIALAEMLRILAEGKPRRRSRAPTRRTICPSIR